jgi:hypothetical protein
MGELTGGHPVDSAVKLKGHRAKGAVAHTLRS